MSWKVEHHERPETVKTKKKDYFSSVSIQIKRQAFISNYKKIKKDAQFFILQILPAGIPA